MIQRKDHWDDNDHTAIVMPTAHKIDQKGVRRPGNKDFYRLNKESPG